MKTVASISFLNLMIITALAQGVSINTGGEPADPSAGLDVNFTNKGFLPPRLTAAQRDAIPSPAAGLVIWCSNCFELQVYNGLRWTNMTGGTKAVGCGEEVYTDQRDGNIYSSVLIGDQCWMDRNLAWLPTVNSSSEGSFSSSCYYVYGYEGTDVNAALATPEYQTYGVLYNWPASVMACPPGWRLPSTEDWDRLVNNLGGDELAGGALKETGDAHWNFPNSGATNSSGFTALPGSFREFYGGFYLPGSFTAFWESVQYESYHAWRRGLYSYSGEIVRALENKATGFSVRCLRDF